MVPGRKNLSQVHARMQRATHRRRLIGSEQQRSSGAGGARHVRPLLVLVLVEESAWSVSSDLVTNDTIKSEVMSPPNDSA